MPAAARGAENKAGTTREDRLLERIDVRKAKLRARPLMPCDPEGSREAFVDMESGARLPMLHCAFEGCTWTCDFGEDASVGP